MPIDTDSLIRQVAGDPTSWSEIQGNLDDIRSYLNAIPTDDLAADTVRREHLRRPVVAGFPISGLFSGFQAAYSRNHGHGTPGGLIEKWGPIAERVTIIPDAADTGSSRKWVTPIGLTFDLPVPTTATVLLTAQLAVRAVGSAEYPGVAGDEDLGYLELVWQARNTATVTVRTESRRYVLPEPFTAQNLRMVANLSLDPGIHDVYLHYVRSAVAAATIRQLDLTNINLVPEVN